LTRNQHLQLIELANAQGIQFISTPFSKEAADLLDGIGVSMFKIGSGEATNIPLLQYIARKQKPMVISTGMTSLEEVVECVRSIRAINERIVVLHCTSTYPTAYKDVRLRAIHLLRDFLPGTPIGLSDHSMGVYTALGAVPLGVRVIEKHFTGSRSWEGPDQKSSIEPHELRDLVAGVHAIHEALQVSHKDILEAERGVQKMARESVVTVADVATGEVFSDKNIWVKRSGSGIPAREFASIIGKRAKRGVPKDTLLRREDIV
jgi:sialic acid synthase SpsE